MSTLKHLTTLIEFREVIRSGAGLVITDSTRTSGMFHPDPDGCSHVQEHSFEQKVIVNHERNGCYFAVKDKLQARERWPDIQTCRSSACSSA